MIKEYLNRVGYMYKPHNKLKYKNRKIYNFRINSPYCIYVDKDNNGFMVNREYKNLSNTNEKFEKYVFESVRFIYLYKDGSTPWSNTSNEKVYFSKLNNAKKEVNIIEWRNKYSYLKKDPIIDFLK